MVRKTHLWNGLTIVFVIILSFSITFGSICEKFSVQVDEYVGTKSTLLVSEDDGTLYSAFTPPDEVLNEDGTTDSAKLIKSYFDQNVESTAEGVVLLKNENNTLPLKAGANITLLGMRTHKPLLGMAVGAGVAGPIVNLEDALSSKNITDFNNAANNGSNTTTYTNISYVGGGFNVNPTMVNVYETINSGLKTKFTYSANNKNMTVLVVDGKFSLVDGGVFQAAEPSISAIEAANPDYKASFSAYGDAAILMFSRPAAEGSDLLPDSDVGEGASGPYSLTDGEREIIKLATDNFETVVVLINTSTPFEIEELKENDKIDAIAWVGMPGCYGCVGIAQVLSGKTTPSGALFDLFAADNDSAPAVQNVGDFAYANADAINRDTYDANASSDYYVIETEGIYVGYRYYETRYYDSIYNQGNAKSAAGVYASNGNWNYSDEVTYGFGYGLSYTSFKQELVGDPAINIAAHDFTMDFKVKVTNTGKVAGKSIVQIYGQAPYIKGGVEKVSIQLLDYEKTKTLQPGESETLTVRVDLQNIASYDEKHDNGDGSFGTYILDEGDYYFSFGNGAHDALNNMLAAQGKTVSDGMDYNGDAAKVFKYNYNYAGGSVDDTTFSVSKNNVKIENQLECADWNNYEGAEKVVYLSRSDWSGTWPKSYVNMTATDEMVDLLCGNYYTVSLNDDTSSIVFDSKETAHKFYELAFAEYDDYRWEELISQMSLEECMGVVACGGNQFRTIESVGFNEAKLTENGGSGVAVALGSGDTNAPWAIQSDDVNAGYQQKVFQCSPLNAASFNKELNYSLGESVGVQALYSGIAILWGPGLNIHRHAYNGRNGEYYSEDPVLSGTMALEFSMGAQEYGLVVSPKHFAFNDQETRRLGISPYMTEQKARETELRAWQIAVEGTKYDTEEHDAGMLGLMTSYSKIGTQECTSCQGLMTGILRNEWGFRGYAVTDLTDDFDLFSSVAISGTTGYDVRMGYAPSGFDNYASNADGVKPSAALYAHDATVQQGVKNAAKSLLYTFAHSNVMNYYNSSTYAVEVQTWWRILYKSMIVGFSLLSAAAIVMSVTGEIKRKKEVK